MTVLRMFAKMEVGIDLTPASNSTASWNMTGSGCRPRQPPPPGGRFRCQGPCTCTCTVNKGYGVQGTRHFLLDRSCQDCGSDKFYRADPDQTSMDGPDPGPFPAPTTAKYLGDSMFLLFPLKMLPVYMIVK
jgi:hypothetical protein